jgi:hypothetical protein
MPTASDLVTDLPADFETFGQAVATSMADLLGGTTGQVLSKASNTNMDFTWVTTDDANAIQNSIVDAKGDLIAASANDTPVRLAVGNSGETLIVDSSTSTGLRYQATQAAGKNAMINGGFDIWQRGTSLAVTGGATTAYLADRWLNYRSVAGLTVSRQVTGDTTNLPFIQYCQRLQRNAGNTATDQLYTFQSVESANAINFAGRAVTFSFYARAGANYSATSSLLSATLFTGTGTDQNVLSTYTGKSTLIAATPTITTTWQRFQYTATFPTSATQFAIQFDYPPTGTAGANDYFEVTGVQVELGSVATAFTRAGGTLQGELAACQRYYYRTVAGGAYTVLGQAVTTSTTAGTGHLQLPVSMRTTPTSIDYSTLGFILPSNNTTYAISSATLNSTLTNGSMLGVDFAVATTTSSVLGRFAINNSTTGYLGCSAEL